MTDDRLIRQYALASVQLAFLCLGINITLTCVQAMGIYHLTRQALKIWHK
jgi:hypothetical protein